MFKCETSRNDKEPEGKLVEDEINKAEKGVLATITHALQACQCLTEVELQMNYWIKEN